ncbi:MAG: IPT/TIG domain-containing protein [Propionibacteriaceae bacterium]|nr:IPT/TIG domain-containing protein [Propionibacteriaceae bacterium]
MDKLSGPAGTTVHVSGEGFAAGETITIRFHTDVCAETTADDSGAFSEVSCTVPEDWQFKMQASITASGTSSIRSGQAAFRVT